MPRTPLHLDANSPSIIVPVTARDRSELGRQAEALARARAGAVGVGAGVGVDAGAGEDGVAVLHADAGDAAAVLAGDLLDQFVQAAGDPPAQHLPPVLRAPHQM